MSWTPPKIIALERLTYQEKIRHWGEEADPWKPSAGRQYRFANVALGERRISMIEGNVTGSPALIGLPCFGILTAYLRYRNALKFVNGRGLQPASRCHKCGARNQCESIVDRRIKAAPAIKVAYDGWLLADGPSEIEKAGWRERRSGQLWKRLTRAALDHPFTSVNDGRVAIYYAEKVEAEATKELARQARKRKRQQNAGELDELHLADIQRAMLSRASRLVSAVNHARKTKGRRELAKLPNQSVGELLEVWHGRELLRAQGRNPTAAAISRWITSTGKSNTSVGSGALDVRVRRDLKRIERLEGLLWNGEPILAKFNPATEFMSEAGQPTPSIPQVSATPLTPLEIGEPSEHAAAKDNRPPDLNSAENLNNTPMEIRTTT